jgi:RNA polymerase sigma factor (sigma-70 family)
MPRAQEEGGKAMREAMILFLAANPASTGRLMLDEEVRDVRERIQRRTCSVALNLEPHWAVRPTDVQRLLNELRPDVVHFNACYSEVQAREISKEIDWVVGMSRAVGDKAAVDFAGGFYQALAYGQDVRNAVEQGRIAMRLDGLRGPEAPCLLVRHGAASALVLGMPANGHPRPCALTLPRRRRSAIDGWRPEGQRRYVIKLEASLSDMAPDLVEELTKLLRKSTGDMMLTIEKIEQGSVILTIATTEAGGARLVELRESGRLRHLAGLEVTLVEEQAVTRRTVILLGEKTARGSRPFPIGGGPPGQESPTRAEFEELIAAHLPELKSRARRLCRQRLDAEDLVQEALLRAIRVSPPDSKRMRVWLLNIVHATFIDLIRRRERAVRAHGSVSGATERPTEPMPWENLSDEAVRVAVESLSDDVRTTYRMYALERRSYAEIAATLNIPISTVGPLIYRARKQLRAALLAKPTE